MVKQCLFNENKYTVSDLEGTNLKYIKVHLAKFDGVKDARTCAWAFWIGHSYCSSEILQMFWMRAINSVFSNDINCPVQNTTCLLREASCLVTICVKYFLSLMQLCFYFLSCFLLALVYSNTQTQQIMLVPDWYVIWIPIH